jgi:hypothetical protein
MSSSEKSGISRKILKVIGIICACLFGLVLIVTILLLTALEPYAERFIKKQVTKNTNGLYSLEFEDIDINLLSTTVTLSNLHLYADSAVYRQQRRAGEASPMLLDLRTPEFKVAGINVLDAIFSKQLSIGTVYMKSPAVSVITDKSVTASEKSPEKQGSGNSITKFIQSVEVGELNIPDASIRQYAWGNPGQPAHSIPQLSLHVLDLELDLEQLKQADHTQIFKADDIQLELKDYVYHTPDSVYTMGFKLFSYSSKEGELLLDNLRVTSDHEANVALPAKEASRMLYDVYVPRLLIEGLDVIEAYRTKQLQMERITLENTKLEVLENPDIPTPKASSVELQKLYDQASKYLVEIGLEEFLIADASLLFRSKFQEIQTVQSLARLNLRLQELQIDSATLFHPRDSLPLQNFLFVAEDYRSSHPLSPYTVSVGKFELSSQEKYLYADSIIVDGDWEMNDSLKQTGKAIFAVINLNAPSLRINDLDLLQAYQTKSMDIGSIEIPNPALDILYEQNVPAPALDVVVQNAYEQVSGFITELTVDQLSTRDLFHTQHIKDGDIILSLKLEDGSMKLNDLHIDSLFVYEQDPRLPLNEIVLSAHNFQYWPPNSTQTFALGGFRYSSKEAALTAKSINVSTNTRQNNRLEGSNSAGKALFDFSARLFKITELDIIQAMNSGRMDIDQITLREPELAITMDRDTVKNSSQKSKQQQATDMLFRFFNPLTVNTIRMEDGTFTYREKRDEIIRTQLLEQVSTTVTGLNLSPGKIAHLGEEIPIEEMVLTASDYTYQSPDSVYTISLDSLHYSSREEVLTARLFNVSPDREAHEQLKKENIEEASSNLFNVSARKFRISGFDLIRSYETGRFNINEMVLTQPEVAILQDKNVKEQRKGEALQKTEKEEESGTTEQTGKKEKAERATGIARAKGGENNNQNQALQQVADIVETFRIDRLRVEDGYFRMNVLKDTVQRSQTLEHVTVVLDDLRLISLQAADPLDMFRVDDIGILVKDYSFLTSDSLYKFHIGEVRTDLNDQLLTIDSIQLEPLFKIEEYQDKLEYAADRIDLKIPGISMQGFQLDAFFNQQEILASKIYVDAPSINMYRDNRTPQNPDRQPYTLQRMLRDVPFRINIDTASIEQGKIVYSEIAPGGVEPGVLTLDETKLLITNITNDSLLLREHDIITADGSTRLMDESRLEVKFKFHMNHPEDLYTYKGSLEPMKFTAFNPLFEKIMFIRMESGRINKATFDVTANAHLAVGNMRFLYQDLDMQLIDKNNPKDPGFLLNAGSWLINNVVIKDNNPSRLGNLRKGDIEAERDYSKSVFNHMSSAMTSGMASSLMPGWVEWIVDTLIGLP